MDIYIFRIPAAQCHRHRNRQACLNAQEPYCGWNEYLMKCDVAPNQNHLVNHWQQEVTTCPVLTDPVDGGWSSWTGWSTCLQESHNTRSHLRQLPENTEVKKSNQFYFTYYKYKYKFSIKRLND